MNHYATFKLFFISALLEHFVSGSFFKHYISTLQFERGKEMLQDNLRRFHEGLGPVPMIEATDYFPHGNQLPQDLLISLANDYISPSEANSLFSSSNYSNQTRIQMINSRLVEFNQYYLFEEQWLNNLMFWVIKANFPKGMNLSSEGIHDHVELMTLKYIENFSKVNPLSDSAHMHHAILTFIHGTVYGPGEVVPVDLHSWLHYVALKDKGFNLSLTFEHYYHTFGERDFNGYVRFLRLAYPEQLADLKWRFGQITPETAQFEWNFEGYLPEKEALDLLKLMASKKIYSEHLLNRIPLTENIENFLKTMAIEPSSASKESYFGNMPPIFRLIDLDRFTPLNETRLMHSRYIKFLYRKFKKPGFSMLDNAYSIDTSHLYPIPNKSIELSDL